MFDARGLLRLILTTAHSHRALGRLTERSPTTVARYRQLAQAVNFTLSDLEKASDQDLERLFCGGRSQKILQQQQPDWSAVALQLKSGFNRSEAYEAYAQGGDGPSTMSYRSFCRGYERYAKIANPVMIQHHRPGATMMTDFAGYRPSGVRGNGDKTEFELFIAVLPASDYTFACVVQSQRTADWIEANERMLRFFQGVPESLVSDNLKAAVIQARGRSRPAVINATYQAFCDHHGCVARPAAPRRPTHKSKVEIGVKLIQRLLRLALTERPLQSREAMNSLLLDILRQFNARPLRRAEGESRRSLYEKLDRPALRPLRQDRFSFVEVRRGLTLGQDYHLAYDRCRYSAPHELLGQKLDLRVSVTTVEIWKDARMVALHPRLEQEGGASTDPAHMPPNHLARRASIEENLLLWSRLHGPAVQAVAQAEAERLNGAAKSSLYRSFRELHARVGSQRLEAACTRSLRIGRPRLVTIRNILDRGMEFADPTDFIAPDNPPLTNENVRGAEYFSEIGA